MTGPTLGMSLVWFGLVIRLLIISGHQCPGDSRLVKVTLLGSAPTAVGVPLKWLLDRHPSQ